MLNDNYTKNCSRKNKNLGNTSKEYYDKFLKKPDDGICQVCGRPTVFSGFANGYRKTCSDECCRQLGK